MMSEFAGVLVLAVILLACSGPADVPSAAVADAASVPTSDSRTEPVVESPSCKMTPLGAPLQKLNAPPSFPPWMGKGSVFVRTDGVGVARWAFSFGESQRGPGFDFQNVIQLAGHEDVITDGEFWFDVIYMNSRILVTEHQQEGEFTGALTWKAYDSTLRNWTPDSVLQMDFDISDNAYSAAMSGCRSGDHWMHLGTDRIFLISSVAVKTIPIEKAKIGALSHCVSAEDGFVVVRQLKSGATGVLKLNMDGSLDSTLTFDGVDQIDGVGADKTGINVVLVSWLDEASAFIGLRRWRVDLSSSSVKVDDIPLVVPALSVLDKYPYESEIMPGGTVITDQIALGSLSRFAPDGSPLLPGTGGLPKSWSTEENRAWEVDGLRVILVGQQQVWWTDAFGNIGCAASGPCWDRAPEQCSDGNPCTADGCDAAHGGCWNEPVPDGYVCGSKARCKAGTCKPLL